MSRPAQGGPRHSRTQSFGARDEPVPEAEFRKGRIFYLRKRIDVVNYPGVPSTLDDEAFSHPVLIISTAALRSRKLVTIAVVRCYVPPKLKCSANSLCALQDDVQGNTA